MKRLIGLPGEIWEEQAGYVYINGKRLNGAVHQARRGATRARSRR